MKATKIRVVVAVECLDVDAVSNLALKALSNFADGSEAGVLKFDDGDEVRWEITREEIDS